MDRHESAALGGDYRGALHANSHSMDSAVESMRDGLVGVERELPDLELVVCRIHGDVRSAAPVPQIWMPRSSP